MKFFVSAEKIEGTCYHEFYKGVWDGKTFWAKDSLCLHDDILSKHSGFEKALRETISSFNPLGVTKVFPAQWKKIGEIVLAESDEDKELYKEADEWVQKTFGEYDCFTIIGI